MSGANPNVGAMECLAVGVRDAHPNLCAWRSFDRIGEHRLRRFTGHYSEDGEQLLTTGDLDIETIGRFKGQQRAHVIVVGLNKDGPVNPRTHRALYVALTRATVGASVVLRRAPQNG